MKRLVLFISTFLLSTVLCAKWRVPFSDGDLPIGEERVAVILGAGPAGLLAAKAILLSGNHEKIFIVEKRDAYDRFNMVNFFPESWPMLRQLGAADDFARIGTSMSYLDFYAQSEDKEKHFVLDDGTPPESFDYRGPVLEILAMPKVGLQVVSIAELQNQLSLSLRKNEKVFFVHGTGTILNNGNAQHEIEIAHKISSHETRVRRLKPDIIIVAEGAHSVNRNNLGIKSIPVLEKQFWCSGSVSLAGLRDVATRFYQILDKSNARNFGIFSVNAAELFLNGVANTGESADDCLRRNAAELISFANSRDHLPTVRQEDIKIVKNSQDLIEITPSKAESFFSGTNVILYGDAAGDGNPKGGIGLSLITTVYGQTLLDLLAQWLSPNRLDALNAYNARVSEIVDYWHIKIASEVF